MVFNSLLIFAVTVAANLHIANVLRITNFYIPRRAANQVDIDCKYDVEGEKLYDVKWYKDGEQFFRCLGDGTVQQYPVEGVMIRYSTFASVGSCPVTLVALTAKSAGDYKCEVSLDGPSFVMVSNSTRLDILMPSRRIQENPEQEAKGSEKHTSQQDAEEGEKQSLGCRTMALKSFVLFLLSILYLLK